MLFSSHVRKVRNGRRAGGLARAEAPPTARGPRPPSAGPPLRPVSQPPLGLRKWSAPTRTGRRLAQGGGCRVASNPTSALPQVNRFNKRRDRALLLTDRHLYKLEPGRQYRVMRAVPLDAVSPWPPPSAIWGGRDGRLPRTPLHSPRGSPWPFGLVVGPAGGGPLPAPCRPGPGRLPARLCAAVCPGTAAPGPTGQGAPWGRGPGRGHRD